MTSSQRRSAWLSLRCCRHSRQPRRPRPPTPTAQLFTHSSCSPVGSRLLHLSARATILCLCIDGEILLCSVGMVVFISWSIRCGAACAFLSLGGGRPLISINDSIYNSIRSDSYCTKQPTQLTPLAAVSPSLDSRSFSVELLRMVPCMEQENALPKFS